MSKLISPSQPVQVTLTQITLPSGGMVQLHGMSPQQAEELILSLGDKRSSRIHYTKGVLTIMSPSIRHERSREIIRDLLACLLEEFDHDFISCGSVTLWSLPSGNGAAEADITFYVNGITQDQFRNIYEKNRLDLSTDTPPNLLVEIDLFSITDIDDYAGSGITEIWIYYPERSQLVIHQDRQGSYQHADRSCYFPDLDICHLLPQGVKEVETDLNFPRVLKAFREQIRDLKERD